MAGEYPAGTREVRDQFPQREDVCMFCKFVFRVWMLWYYDTHSFDQLYTDRRLIVSDTHDAGIPNLPSVRSELCRLAVIICIIVIVILHSTD